VAAVHIRLGRGDPERLRHPEQLRVAQVLDTLRGQVRTDLQRRLSRRISLRNQLDCKVSGPNRVGVTIKRSADRSASPWRGSPPRCPFAGDAPRPLGVRVPTSVRRRLGAPAWPD
jgi:hypothetical protein